MISNASPLINFAKVNKLELLIKCIGTVVITEGVLAEIVKKEGFAQEAQLLSEQIVQQKIFAKKLSSEYLNKAEQLRNVFKLGVGESEAIALALQEEEADVLMDDSDGREAAELNGLNPVGSLRVLLLAFDKGIVNEGEVLKIFRKMVENKFWMSGEVALKFLELFEKLKKSKRKR